MPVANWFIDPIIDNDLVDQDRDLKFNEGMFGPQYNNSARALMGEIAKWVLDQSGGLTTTGTSTEFALTTAQNFNLAPTPVGLVNGMTLRLKLHTAPGANATLAVDDLDPKPLRIATSTALPESAYPAGQLIGVRYNASDDCFYVADNLPASAARPGIVELATAAEARAQALDTRALTPASMESILPLGTRMAFYQAVAPVGWEKLDDAELDNAAIRVVTGTGGGVGGSVDFDAAFSASRTPGGTVGDTTLSANQIPAHKHFVFADDQVGTGALTNANQAQSGDGLSGNNSYVIKGDSTDATIGLSSSIGGSQPHSHSFTGAAMSFAVKYVDMIICERTAA